MTASAEITITPRQADEPDINISVQNGSEDENVEPTSPQESTLPANDPIKELQPIAKPETQPQQSITDNIQRDQAIVVLDGSGSMWGVIDDVSKIEIARDVVSNVLQDWPDNTELGLMSYGHREKGNCDDIETLIAPDTVDAEEFRTVIGNIQPKGKTPMSQAVIEAAKSLKYTENKATVILISDGEETCGLDPCAIGRELEAAGVDFTAHVIGFDVASENTTGLRCLADTTGGQFLAAANADELQTSLQESVVAVVAPSITASTSTLFGSIAVSHLDSSDVGLCSVSSECYNSTSEGWVGKLSSATPSMQVMPGDYKIKVGRHYYGTITVVGGEQTEVAFGRIETDRLGTREIGICDLGSECYNSASDGWAGELTSRKQFISLPAGQYQAKIESHVSNAITVSPGNTTTLELSKLSVTEPLGQQAIGVCANGSECYNSASDGWMGELTAAQPSMYVFGGNYQLKFGSHLSAPFNASEGQDISYVLGRVGADAIDQQEIALCAQSSECYNSTSDGWVGKLTTQQPALLVPVGQYKIKQGNSFSAPIDVQFEQSSQ